VPDLHFVAEGGAMGLLHGPYMFWSTTSMDGLCMSALQGTGGGTLVLGLLFFKSLFVVFDIGGGRIGMASKPLT